MPRSRILELKNIQNSDISAQLLSQNRNLYSQRCQLPYTLTNIISVEIFVSLINEKWHLAFTNFFQILLRLKISLCTLFFYEFPI